MVIAQSGGDGVGELMCGLNYLLQGLTEGGWQSVRTKEDLEVPSIGYMLNDQTHTFAVDWTRVHGELPAGTYRIGKNITNHTKLDQRETQCVYSEPFIIGE